MSNNSKPSTPQPRKHFVVLQGGHTVDLDDEARRLAHANRPESGETEPTDVETAIGTQAEQDHVHKAQETNTAINEHGASFRQLEQRMPVTTDLENHTHHAQTHAEMELAGNPELARLRKDERSALRSLRIFVREHRLKRDAHTPPSMWAHYGIVCVIALIELIGNSLFFAEGSAIGFAGGLVLAIMLVAFNVGSGFFVGKSVVPNRNHIERARRFRANALLTLYLLVVLGVNLMVAHYRDLCVAQQTATGDVAGKLIRSPFDLTFHSILLLMLGVLAAVLTVWKAYQSDDPYPHYGKFHRKYRSARDAYEDAKGGILKRMLAGAEAIPAACDDTVGQAAQLIEQMEHEQLAAAAALESYDTTRQHLEQDCHVLLRQFRDENSAIRTTPPPDYFTQFPILADQANRAEVQSMAQRLLFHRRHLSELKADASRVKAEGPRRVTDLATRFDQFVDEHCQRMDEQTQADHKLGEDDEPPSAAEVSA